MLNEIFSFAPFVFDYAMVLNFDRDKCMEMNLRFVNLNSLFWRFDLYRKYPICTGNIRGGPE